jgi:hypothetical protein
MKNLFRLAFFIFFMYSLYEETKRLHERALIMRAERKEES